MGGILSSTLPGVDAVVMLLPVRRYHNTFFRTCQDLTARVTEAGWLHAGAPYNGAHTSTPHLAFPCTCMQVLPPKITMRDFAKVLTRARPTVGKADLQIFENFTTEFGEEAS